MATAILIIWILSALIILLGLHLCFREDLFELFCSLVVIACIWFVWTSSLIYQGANPWLKAVNSNSTKNTLTIENPPVK